MRVDRVFGIAVSVLSILFLALAVPSISGDWQSGPDARYYTVGPRLFPYVAGALTLLFGVLIAVRTPGGDKLGALRAPGAARNVALALAIAVAYASVLGVLGFTLATALALGSFFLAFGTGRWWIGAAIAIAVPLLTRVVFHEAFLLELPAGSLGLPF